MENVELFESARPRLVSLAHRIVGSRHDAEDAVQTAWLRLSAADPAEVANPEGWLTTVTARVCLDLLRARRRRGELPLLSEDLPVEAVRADEAFLRREDVSRALLVLLGELSPRQRVAYVLHDLFAVPFDGVAAVLGTSTDAAKKLASRARVRLRGARPGEGGGEHAGHADIVEAFLAAARGGDIARLVDLLAPDAVRRADPRLLPAGAPVEVRGAAAIAEETTAFRDRIAAAAPVLVGGCPGAVIAPGGHPYALIRFAVGAGRVAAIDITPYTPGAVGPAAAPGTARAGR
ncbi:sigma-70 family RNA polymerase sigma factor [Streptomonospora nanhaiensis]|uniref:RNA polymerase sigma-70 factor (ECF subfamily) n=1 Tax=Streptomonospora nanhaiensis TaxID=1323731 RepID=A0A853BW45_9ACTN|nr:sigma-70 family RNA polymerase sigma factor [Streptomonospora nanhaiensis]MBV2363662.1 sigma-70 family RNA polymerase sigma factor [Streptomonospora nanhaiensis]MBX9391569.1 sigma-70 family RNA polymerase sigma factor [Streptomonospora nanhaiensis]NYI98707.1 RNA polymerase sigma-70 factor (ECF subfamily) [Streptomonospora nanhaiensis]